MPLYDGVLSDCVILNDIVRLKELEIVFEKKLCLIHSTSKISTLHFWRLCIIVYRNRINERNY